MAKKILYVVGYSIVAMMILGLILNYLLPLFGIDKPLSSIPIWISFWGIVISILIIYLYKYKLSFRLPKVPLQIYMLILLPIMAIVGAELVNYYHSNILLMILMVAIVVVVVICLFTKVIPSKYWAFAVWMIALSIVLHRALISADLWGADNIIEYGIYRVTDINGYWVSNFVDSQCPNYNTSLSITIFPVMLSKIIFISGFWIFKVVFPVLLSLVPVAVYEILKEQFSKQIAFISAFLVMASYPFFTVVLSTDKQLMAILFMSLFTMMMFDKNISPKYKLYLLAVLGIGIILSHYATALLFIGIITISSLLLRNKSKALPVALAIFLCLSWFGWYWFAQNGYVIKQFTGLSHDISSVTPLSSPTSEDNIVPGLNVTTGETLTPTLEMARNNSALHLLTHGSNVMPMSMLIFYIIMQALIGIGYIVALWQRFIKKDKSISSEMLLICFLFVAILFMEIVLPRFPTIIALDRIYPVYIIFLIPFMFIGAKLLLRYKTVIGCAIFIVLFFGLNSGFIYEVANKPLATSIALSRGNDDYPVFTKQEIEGAKWAIENINTKQLYYDDISRCIFNYADVTSTPITGNIYGTIMSRRFGEQSVSNDINKGSYIYLREFNQRESRFSLGYPDYALLDVKLLPVSELGEFGKVLTYGYVVYQNEDCKIIKTVMDYDG